MLGKILIFTFCFIGMFGLLMTYLPTEFTPIEMNEIIGKIRTEFNTADVLVYNQTAYDNMTYPYLKDYSFALPPPQQLRVQWDEAVMHIGWNTYYRQGIWLTHLTDNLWGYWYGYHMLEITFRDGTKVGMSGSDMYGFVILKEDLINAWESDNNFSVFYGKCKDGHITTSIIFQCNDTSKTIGENWDAGTLGYKMTYDVDLTKSGFSAWSIVGTLLSFVFPTVNISGVGGAIINGAIGAVMSIMIAYTVYKLIAGIIPFLSGGSGD